MEQLNEALLQLVANKELPIPPYPKVATQLNNIMADNDYDLKEVVKLIATDQALSSTVLRHANSAFYSGQNEATSLTQAINRIGSRELIRVVMAINLGSKACSDGPLVDLKFLVWRQALVSASQHDLLHYQLLKSRQPPY